MWWPPGSVTWGCSVPTYVVAARVSDLGVPRAYLCVVSVKYIDLVTLTIRILTFLRHFDVHDWNTPLSSQSFELDTQLF